ncbi:MAG: hypothetical protein EBS33_03565 [Alphaproteobacteria bacterium]|nr:hypothetical protein [Alphaproteobacteria bacterium]
MTYKKNMDWDREKKIHKVIKGSKVDKHRKFIYNTLSNKSLDNDHSDDSYGYHGNNNYTKRR